MHNPSQRGSIKLVKMEDNNFLVKIKKKNQITPNLRNQMLFGLTKLNAI